MHHSSVAMFLLAAAVAGAPARGDILYAQAPTGSGTLLYSSYWDPDGSDYDEYVWDGFTLPAAGNITEIRWRGGGAQPITDFEISIYGSIPVGTQPDLGGPPLRHYIVSDYGAGNAGQTFAGTFGGVAMYDYHFVLPTAFVAAAATPYWVQIEAWTPGWPSWGLATGSGGNGNHFHRSLAVTGDFRFYYASGDAAFTLVGTPVNCSAPTITVNPSPVALCSGGGNATFTAAATGTGPFTYRWRQNGYPVNDGPNGGGHGGGATISGATAATLTIQNPSYWADVGTYDCVISNACGPSTTSGAALAVSLGGPSVTSGPGSVSTCPGGVVTLATTASNGPLAYQWKKDGVVIVDGATAWGSVIAGAATGTLAITNTGANDSGSYVCVVSNACSSIATGAALVAVCPADFDCNGFVNGDDFDGFVWEFYWGTAAADFDRNGFVNGDDFDGFVIAFESGC